MAYTNIDDPSAYFQMALYTGNGGTLSITNDGNSDLQPDWIWLKSRSITASHNSYDSSRGTGKHLAQNTTDAEQTYHGVTAFNSDGFTISSGNDMNYNGATFVAWQWKANGGTTSNLSGNLASVVQVNQDAGFSIVKYTGSGGNGQSVNHGLGLVPEVIITKARNGTGDWIVYHKSIGTANFLKLNTNAASAGSSPYAAADPTSTAFFVSNNLIYVGELGANFISYVFSSIQGYSKFGSYLGNGNANGPMIYTGFKPAWVLIKQVTDAAGDDWILYDNKREPENVAIKKLFPNQSAAESSSYDSIDMLSNGFKARTNLGGTNSTKKTYIYMAFAESSFVSSTGIPTTAR